MITRDQVFMNMAKELAKLSKDKNTKLGTIAVGPKNEIRGGGYNSFPMGLNDFAPERQLRPKKLLYFGHAEENMISLAARTGISLNGCRIYTPWQPCSRCSRAIIQAGMVEVIIEHLEIPERWYDDFMAGVEMLNEVRIKVRQINRDKNLRKEDFVRGK